MDLKVLHDVRFYDTLLSIDQELARQWRGAGCPLCAGRLDSARFRRKPRGGPVDLGPEHAWRLSLCCDACRKRVTTPSVRFLPHRIYYGAVLVIAGAQKLSRKWVARLQGELGVDRRTLRRWRSWWQEQLPRSPFWQARKGTLLPPVVEVELSGSLLDRFAGDFQERLVSCLGWLSALPTTWARAGM